MVRKYKINQDMKTLSDEEIYLRLIKFLDLHKRLKSVRDSKAYIILSTDKCIEFKRESEEIWNYKKESILRIIKAIKLKEWFTFNSLKEYVFMKQSPIISFLLNADIIWYIGE